MQTDCFPDATADWPKAPVGVIAEVSPRYRVETGHEYPFVEMAAVAENFGGIVRFDKRAAQSSGLTRFGNGDTLFAKITPCPQNGKVAFVSDLPDVIGLGSTEFIVLSPKANCAPRFLYHLLCSYEFRGRAVGRMEGSTGRQRVPEDVFTKRLQVPVPEVEEQRAIAHILDGVDATIAQATEAAERTRSLQEALIEDFFSRVDSKQQRLGEFLSELRYGTSRASNERGWGSPTLRIPNVIGDQMLFDDIEYIELPDKELQRLAMKDGDVLVVRTNGNPNYVGRSAVFHQPDSRVWAFASYLIRVRLKGGILPEYVNLFMGTERGRRELLRRVTTSAGNHNINSASLRLLSIPVPVSQADQETIVRTANACRTKMAAMTRKAEALRGLKWSLLNELVTGRTRVSTGEAVS